MTTRPQEITLKVFVNKTKNCVAFVESDSDFVDVLLSFLTLPVCTVVRLLNKQSSLGCFDKLYQGVEQLDKKCLVTAACKSMLTNPLNSSGVKCQKLRINIDEMIKLYKCSSDSCRQRNYSYYSGLKCQCGGGINKAVSHDLNQDEIKYGEFHGVFIQGVKFVVTDALCIPLVEDLFTTLNECGNGDCYHLEERLVKIGREQVLLILKRSLISDTPLTDVLLQNGQDITPKFSDPSVEKTVEKKAFDKEKKIYKLKMVFTCNKVLYAVASEDFVDLIFSFLTFPLGTLKKHLGSRFRIGCLNNLYGSAERLRSSGYIVAGCEERLLNPKLAPYFNCENQVIGVEEEKQVIYYTCPYCCKLISDTSFICKSHGYGAIQAQPLTLVDPKSQPSGAISSHGSYCQKLMYMVTDELVVTPLSLAEVVSFRKESSNPIKMEELSVAEEEALDFLGIALASNTALTDAFLARTVAVFASVDEKGE